MGKTSGKYIFSLCQYVNQTTSKHKSYMHSKVNQPELDFLLPVKITQNEKSSPQSYSRWIYLLMNICLVSQSVCYQVLNSFRVMVCLKENVQIFHIGQTLKEAHVVFTDMNRYILTEGRNFKTFLKANYAIVLYSCYLLTIKNM